MVCFNKFAKYKVQIYNKKELDSLIFVLNMSKKVG